MPAPLLRPLLLGFLGSTLILSAQTTPDETNLVHKITSPPFKGDVAREREYYDVTPLPFPKDLVLEAGGLDILPGNRLAVTTRRGEVWLVDGAFDDDVSKVRYTLFATGLHEPLSVFWRDGWLYVTERAGIMRLRDTTGDDRSDEAEVVTNDWGLSGDYHEYAFSSPPDANGDIWSVLCLTSSLASKAPWRGWAIRTNLDGRFTPTAAGIRSPGGVGFNAAGDAFYTENQGFWVGSSALKHLGPGSFQGAVPALDSWDLTQGKLGPKPVVGKTGRPITDHQVEPRYLPPAVLLPHHRLGHSPTGMDFDPTGTASPFGKQLIVGEHTFSHLQRVDLEKVNGIYQGAVFPYLGGMQSGIIGVRFAADGTLFLSGSDRGWGAQGGKPFCIERIRWKKQAPFEVETMKVTPDGFELAFTQPVDAASAGDVKSYQMEAWTYLQSNRPREYGSDELDKLNPVVASASVAADGRKVRLVVHPLTRGHVHELRFPGVRDRQGATLPHPIAWYTVNEIPQPNSHSNPAKP